ncbi:MAG: HAMP domain-containing histidine kinase [Ardenticatenales bacterium]|nr:HAMP domain-containing histidine kinase [Ardenticatenales bacterium]
MSLRLRLALWYSTLTGFIILTLGLVGYAVHSRTQYDTLDHALEGAVAHVAAAHLVAATSHEPDIMLAPPILPHVGVRVYDLAGTLNASSPNSVLAPELDPATLLTQLNPPPYDALVGLVPSMTVPGMDQGTFALATTPEGRWRFYVRPLPSEGEYLIAVASLSPIDGSVETLRHLLPLLALVGAAITLLAGGLLAGRALSPVAVLTETARTIARSHELGRRVPVGDRQDELGRMALTFNEMLASLEQAAQLQQRFVADASHELRAPLTVIQANLELLERQPQMPLQEQREVLAEASRETRRLARLVADLLALARADAGVPLRHTTVELDRVLLEALRETRHLAKGQSLGVGTFEPLQVRGDEDRLKQLVLIVLDNALKYTPPGGKVSLALRQSGAMAELCVQDDGVGIPSEALPHVFDRFYRADPARSHDPGGTGLGLPIARWIVQQHGGRMTLESELERGTTVRIYLPLPAQHNQVGEVRE